jgi:hypothetical protein
MGATCRRISEAFFRTMQERCMYIFIKKTQSENNDPKDNQIPEK